MNIIPTNITSFEEIVNNLIKDIKITGLENIRKLLEAIDQALFLQKQDHMRVASSSSIPSLTKDEANHIINKVYMYKYFVNY